MSFDEFEFDFDDDLFADFDDDDFGFDDGFDYYDDDEPFAGDGFDDDEPDEIDELDDTIEEANELALKFSLLTTLIHSPSETVDEILLDLLTDETFMLIAVYALSHRNPQLAWDKIQEPFTYSNPALHVDIASQIKDEKAVQFLINILKEQAITHDRLITNSDSHKPPSAFNKGREVSHKVQDNRQLTLPEVWLPLIYPPLDADKIQPEWLLRRAQGEANKSNFVASANDEFGTSGIEIPAEPFASDDDIFSDTDFSDDAYYNDEYYSDDLFGDDLFGSDDEDIFSLGTKYESSFDSSDTSGSTLYHMPGYLYQLSNMKPEHETTIDSGKSDSKSFDDDFDDDFGFFSDDDDDYYDDFDDDFDDDFGDSGSRNKSFARDNLLISHRGDEDVALLGTPHYLWSLSEANRFKYMWRYLLETSVDTDDIVYQHITATIKQENSNLAEDWAYFALKIGDIERATAIAPENKHVKLAKFIKENPIRLIPAYRALLQSGTFAIPQLLAYLQELNADHSSNAQIIKETLFYLIGDIGDTSQREIIEYLIASLEGGNDNLREIAAHVLEQLGWIPENDEQEVIYRVAIGNWATCVKLGKKVIPALGRVLQNDTIIRCKQALKTMVLINHPDAVFPITTALKSEFSGEMIALYCDALVNLNGVDAIPAIVSKIESNTDLVYKTLEAFGTDAGSAIDAVIKMLRRTAELEWEAGQLRRPWIRDNALAERRRIQNVLVAIAPNNMQKLYGGLKNTVSKFVDIKVRIAILEVIGRITAPEAAYVIAPLLADTTENVHIFDPNRPPQVLGRICDTVVSILRRINTSDALQFLSEAGYGVSQDKESH